MLLLSASHDGSAIWVVLAVKPPDERSQQHTQELGCFLSSSLHSSSQRSKESQPCMELFAWHDEDIQCHCIYVSFIHSHLSIFSEDLLFKVIHSSVEKMRQTSQWHSTPSMTIYQMLVSRGRWESCKQEMKLDEKGFLEGGSVWANAGKMEESSAENQLKQSERMWSLVLWETGSGSTGLRDGFHGVQGKDNTREARCAVPEVCLFHDGATWKSCRVFLFVFNYAP